MFSMQSGESSEKCFNNAKLKMMKNFVLIIMISVLLIEGAGAQQNTKITGIGDSGADVDVKLECLNCHSTMTPDLVDQWGQSKHALDNVKCNVCHGEKTSEDFIARPQKERCRACHPDQVKTISESRMNRVTCSACHPIHKFSSMIARKSNTCTGCHKKQWELYNGSTMEKKGVQCSECHFHKDYFTISNHSLKVEAQNCEGCHNSTMIAQVNAIQNEIEGLLLEAIKVAIKQAEITLIENDGSMGFHNPEKGREMLTIPKKTSERFSLSKVASGFGVLFLAILLILIIKRKGDKR